MKTVVWTNFLSPEELGYNGLVKWSHYEYVPIGKYLPDGKEMKKIALVQKETPPSQLFKYFTDLLDLLAEYPSHTFMARWQLDPLDSLVNNLPQGRGIHPRLL